VTTTTAGSTTTAHPTTTAGSTTTAHPTTTAHETTTTEKATTTTARATTTTAAATTTTQQATTTTATTTPREVTTTTAAATTTTAAATTTTTPRKVFVCKYVGKPGVDERLQTGQNPISVSVNSLTNGPIAIGARFEDAQGASVVIAFDTGQPEPDVSQCPTPQGGTTTTVRATTTTLGGTTTTTTGGGGTTTTLGGTTTTTGGGTTTTTAGGSTTTTLGGSTTTSSSIPTGGLFAINVGTVCTNGVPLINITFPNRPELNGQPAGTLTFSTGGSTPLTFIANASVQVPYPPSAGTGPVTLTYVVAGQSATPATVTFPPNCTPITTTTTAPGGSTTTTAPGGTTTTVRPGGSTTTLPPGIPATFSFGAASTVCVREVPTIRITFLNQFPTLAGQTGTLTMASVATGAVLSTQPLVYQPGTTVDLLYPGTRVNADGSIADVPGWNLNSAGFWVRDPADEFLRAGINLTYTVNPTATATVSYPPESANCANPDGPFPPGTPTTVVVPGQPGIPVRPATFGAAPGTPGAAAGGAAVSATGALPSTGSNDKLLVPLALLTLAGGATLLLVARRPRRP
jgi:hypothetical protein